MKKLIALLLAVCLLSGCQLATEKKRKDHIQDRLVGVFITFERMDLEFDIEGWLRDNPGALDGEEITLEPGEGLEYAQRLPVTASEDGWVVPGHEGLSMGRLVMEDYETTFVSEGVSEVNSHFMTGDDGDSVEVEGTVYLPAGSQVLFCSNPVYQTAGGEYYVVQVDTFQSSLETGAMSQSIQDARTQTVDGESRTDSAKFTTTIDGVTISEKVVLIRMSAEHTELGRAEYIPGQLPDSIEVDGAYLIVEEIAGETVSRKLYQPGDEQLCVYYKGEQPWCLPDITEIQWPE